MKIRIHWKLTVLFFSVCVSVFLVTYGYLYSRLKSSFEDNLRSEVKRQLFLSKELLEKAAATGTVLDTQGIAYTIGQATGVRATIVAVDGTVIGDSDLTADQVRVVENHKNRPEIQEAMRRGFGLSRRFSYTVKKYMVYMAVPYNRKDSNGVIRLAVPLQDIETLIREIQRTLSVGLLIVLMSSLFLTGSLGAVVSQPLVQMSMIARRMADGDFSRKAAVLSSDEIGELAGALNRLSDEVKEQMETIKNERAKLHLVLSSMSEGVIVVDERERVLVMNPSARKLFLVDVDPVGRNLLDMIRNSELQGMVDDIFEGTRQYYSGELTLHFPELKELKINAVPIIHEEKIFGVVLVFHDISQLRQLEQIRQDFVANVSHELRTPIASIKGYAETLLDGALDDKNHAKEFVDIIFQESNRLAQLINDLLDLSKIENGKMNMTFLPVDMTAVLRRAVTVVETQAKSKNIDLKMTVLSDFPSIRGDQTWLSQAVINLLDNAIKYTPEKGAVEAALCVIDGAIRVDVSDTGIGIAAEDLPRLFERFYRADKARSRQIGGTGLGLSIVKHIIQAHHGKVWAVSEPGKGSTFSFTIPIV